ncbi:MAG TPA: aldose epimerase family protein [Acidobacteriaceae bacterium]|nr:aldose epimerase family protein [Acidobacteriaceae bacterium]
MKRVLIAASLALFAGSTVLACGQTSVKEAAWGKTPDGQAVAIYTLNDGELQVRITTFGARVVSIDAPDRNGAKADVVLGYNSLAGYEADKSTYFGAIVGRYGNRIAKGTFSIDGTTYHIPKNDHGINTLHGGTTGFDQMVWTGRQIPNGVEMTLVSPDGDMGFPGQLTAHVRYTLEGRSLRIVYSATTTKPTVVNLTNHTYFNLSGEGHGTILGEEMMINADKFTPTDAGLIPTGKLEPVSGTPLDFRKPTAIGARINDNFEQLKLAGGYDQNFVLNGEMGKLHLAAKVVDPASGRTMTVETTQPGVQFYSGNFLNGTLTGVSGVKYVKHAGFAMETQHFPDSPNHAAFPSTVLRPGQTLHSETVYTFGVEK